MTNKLDDFTKAELQNAKNKMVESIKILLYKNDKKIFDIINFEDDTIYKEPILYAYFSNKNQKMTEMNQIVFSFHMDSEKDLELKTDEFGKIYLQNFGWIITTLANEQVIFSKKKNELFFESEKTPFSFEGIQYIDNTKIEVLKYPIPLLKQCYFNVDGKEIQVEIEKITQRHLKNLTKAYNLIRTCIPSQFLLIESYTPKCVIFNVDTYQRNSFATKQAHGIGFYNAYQGDYDEVFFVDDIAHQTGHVIFNTLLFEPSDYFKIDKSTIMETITMPNGDFIEKRDIYVIFHALYTYYTSFICLDTCIENNVWEGKQRHEAMGRIAFYINKCYTDLLLVDSPINSENKANEYFTENGLLIYRELKAKWKEMYKKWFEITKHFDMSNQPYNFTYSKFLELNPLLQR